MNNFEIKSQWEIFKGRLKQRLAHYTANDSLFHEGKAEELSGMIQQQKIKTRKNLQRAIKASWNRTQ